MRKCVCLWRWLAVHSQGIDCGADFKYSWMSRLSNSICRWCLCTPDEYFYHIYCISKCRTGCLTNIFHSLPVWSSKLIYWKDLFHWYFNCEVFLVAVFFCTQLCWQNIVFSICLFTALSSKQPIRFFFFISIHLIISLHFHFLSRTLQELSICWNKGRPSGIRFHTTHLRHFRSTLTSHNFSLITQLSLRIFLLSLESIAVMDSKVHCSEHMVLQPALLMPSCSMLMVKIILWFKKSHTVQYSAGCCSGVHIAGQSCQTNAI